MFRVPGVTDQGRGIVTDQLTEHIDIFPTIVDLATTQPMPACQPGKATITTTCTEGVSLRPLLASPNSPVKQASYSVFDRGIPHNGTRHDEETLLGATISNCLLKQCAMGYTMLTRVGGSTFRYTEWVHFQGPTGGFTPDWTTSYGTEL